MAVIAHENYQNIADFYNTAQTVAEGAIPYYYEAAEEIVMLNEFDPEIDLLIPFYNAYLTATAIYNAAPLAAINAVRTLQRHVLQRATQDDGTRYINISDWMTADGNNVRVGLEFAIMSDSAGYTLDSDRVIE